MPPYCNQLVLFKGAQLNIPEPDPAPVAFHYPDNGLEKDALARAALADNGGDLLFGQFQADILQNLVRAKGFA